MYGQLTSPRHPRVTDLGPSAVSDSAISIDQLREEGTENRTEEERTNHHTHNSYSISKKGSKRSFEVCIASGRGLRREVVSI